MGPIPSLSFTGGASGPATGGTAGGGISWSQGDFNPTVAGSGFALQSAGSGLSPLVIGGAILAGVIAWALLRR